MPPQEWEHSEPYGATKTPENPPLTPREIDAIRALCGGIELKLSSTPLEDIDERLHDLKEVINATIIYPRESFRGIKNIALEWLPPSPDQFNGNQLLFLAFLDHAKKQKAFEEEEEEERRVLRGELSRMKAAITEVEAKIDASNQGEEVEIDLEEVQNIVSSLITRGKKRRARDDDTPDGEQGSDNDHESAASRRKRPRL